MEIRPLHSLLPRAMRKVRARLNPPPPPPACRAPFTSLHIDQFGDARPCCQSTRVLGNVQRSTIAEIWRGTALADLRRAVTDGDLSLGCEHCQWSGRTGRSGTYAVRFDEDRLPAAGAGPTRLELAPSNACNLQCVMCNGDWSSSIRLHREGRPALDRRFDDRLLREVEALASELDQIHLFGGEPFLMPEALRLLEIAASSGVRTVVTTNGTVLTPRVERLLDRQGVDLVVSIDGTSREIYESIRVGASWDALQANLDRFQEIAREHGNRVDVAHCLMTTNWHELPEHLAWAERRGADVYINDVLHPVEASLHHLPPPELALVVAALRARDADVAHLRARWLATWEQGLTSLELTLADASTSQHLHLSTQAEVATEAPSGALQPGPGSFLDCLRAPIARVRLRLDDRLRVSHVAVDGLPDRVPLVPTHDLVGRTSAAVRTVVAWGPDPPSTSVARRAPDIFVEERNHPIVRERRTSSAADGAITFEFWVPEIDDDRRRALATSVGRSVGQVVAMELDSSGILTSIEPAELAAELHLRTDIGSRCDSTEAALTSDRATPAPTVVQDEVAPGLVLVDLAWGDGARLIAVARGHERGTTVHLVDLLGQLSNPSDQVNRAIPQVEPVDFGAMGSSKDRQGGRLRRLPASEVECLVVRYRDGSTVNALAAEFGIHRKTVMDHLRRAGIPRRVDALRWTPDQLAQATDLYRQGQSVASIGSKFGLDPSTVSRRLKHAGVVLRPRRGMA